jgi:aminoglycoside phosphotransferase (APT) family kinase protein
MPVQPPKFGPRCGNDALGHDEDRAFAFALAVDDAASPFAVPIEVLEQEIGTRFVVVALGTPRVVYSHDPELVLEQWERCQREGFVALHNLRTSNLRFPLHGRPEARLITVSRDPVRCVLADAADSAALALLAAQLRPEAATTDPAIGEGGVTPTT